MIVGLSSLLTSQLVHLVADDVGGLKSEKDRNSKNDEVARRVYLKILNERQSRRKEESCKVGRKEDGVKLSRCFENTTYSQFNTMNRPASTGKGMWYAKATAFRKIPQSMTRTQVKVITHRLLTWIIIYVHRIMFTSKHGDEKLTRETANKAIFWG